jgi:hypothetical protein
MEDGSGHKDDKEEEVKRDLQKESVSVTPSESEATPPKPLNKQEVTQRFKEFIYQ